MSCVSLMWEAGRKKKKLCPFPVGATFYYMHDRNPVISDVCVWSGFNGSDEEFPFIWTIKFFCIP